MSVKRLIRLLSALTLLFAPLFSFAQTLSQTDVTTQLFQVSRTDPSVIFLGQMFGTVGSVLTGTSGQLLGTIFQIFNIGLLVISGVFLIWGIGSAVMATSQEGEFMGRQGNPGITITRTVAGIGLLVPNFSTGYSTIQVFVMWVVLQGIGFANTAWSKALDYLQSGGVIFAQGGHDISQSVNLSGTILEAQVCMYGFQAYYLGAQSLAASQTQPGDPPNPLATTFIPAFRPTWNMNDRTVSFPSQPGNNDSGCGLIYWGQPDVNISIPNYSTLVSGQQTTSSTSGSTTPLSNNSGYAQRALQAVIEATSPAAQQIAAPIEGVSVNTIINNAAQAVVAGAATWVNLTLPARSNSQFDLGGFYTTAKSNGWIFAGSYYYTLTSIQRSYNSAASVALEFKTPTFGFSNTNRGQYIDFSAPPAIDTSIFTADTQNILYAYQTAATAARAALGLAQQADQAAHNLPARLSVNAGDIFSIILAPLLGVINFVMAAMIMMTGDPVLKMQTIGNTLMAVIIVIWIGGTLTMFLLGLGLNVCVGSNPIGPAVFDAITFFIPIFMALAGSMFVTGFMLAIYIPLVPFIVFTFTVFGWFVAVFESMIAAPLVALGLTHPEGQNLMGKSEQAVMLLLNVFLRPVLMIFGLLGGMILSYIALTILDKGFIIIVQSYSRGLFEFIFVFTTYCSLAVSLIHVCYSLIHYIPDKVMRWIGTQTESAPGVEQALSKSEGAAQQMGQQVGEATQSTIKGAAEVGKKLGGAAKGPGGGIGG